MSGGNSATSAARARPDEVSVEDWLRANTQIGDLVLVGGSDWASRAIQYVTDSPFSHTVVVIAPDTLIEAYDYKLTLNEEDEGVYSISFADFAARESELARLSVHRMPPGAFDVAKLRDTAATVRRVAPSYPTLAALVFLFAQWSGRAARHGDRRWLRPSPRQISAQARFWGDGPRRVHCAELATRLYCASGATIEFQQPLMRPYIDAINGDNDYTATPSTVRIDEGPAEGQELGMAATGFAEPVGGLANAIRSVVNRMLRRSEPDIADYIMPNDFATAVPFREVALLSLGRRATSRNRLQSFFR